MHLVFQTVTLEVDLFSKFERKMISLPRILYPNLLKKPLEIMLYYLTGKNTNFSRKSVGGRNFQNDIRPERIV